MNGDIRYVTLITPGGVVLSWSNEGWASVAAHFDGVKLGWSKHLIRRGAVPVVPVGSPVTARRERVAAALPTRGSSDSGSAS